MFSIGFSFLPVRCTQTGLVGVDLVFSGQLIDGFLVLQGFEGHLRFELCTTRFSVHFLPLHTTWFQT